MPKDSDKNLTETIQSPLRNEALLDRNETETVEALLQSDLGEALHPVTEDTADKTEAKEDAPEVDFDRNLTEAIDSFKFEGERITTGVVESMQEAPGLFDKPFDSDRNETEAVRSDFYEGDRSETVSIESPLYEPKPALEPYNRKDVSLEDIEESDLNITGVIASPDYHPERPREDDEYYSAETQAPSLSKPLEFPKPKIQADPNSALSNEQRQLLEVVARLSDTETFGEADQNLSAEQQAELARWREQQVQKAESDRGPFEVPEIREVLEDETSLKDDQKQLLGVVSRVLKDEVAFETKDKVYAEMNREGTTFKDFVEPEIPPDSEFDVADLDAIGTPPQTVDDIIHFPTRSQSEIDKEFQAPDNLVGRIRRSFHEMPSYARRVRKQLLRPDRVLGPIAFVALTLSVFLLPGYLQRTFATSSTTDSVAQDQVSANVSDSLDKEIPDALNDPEIAGQAATEQGSNSGAIMGGATGGGAPSGGPLSVQDGGAEIVQARDLATKGYYKRAHAMFKDYLAAHPKAMALRIELIRILIQGKEKRLARIECIEALKLNPTYEQVQAIQDLYTQVQLDD